MDLPNKEQYKTFYYTSIDSEYQFKQFLRKLGLHSDLYYDPFFWIKEDFKRLDNNLYWDDWDNKKLTFLLNKLHNDPNYLEEVKKIKELLKQKKLLKKKENKSYQEKLKKEMEHRQQLGLN